MKTQIRTTKEIKQEITKLAKQRGIARSEYILLILRKELQK